MGIDRRRLLASFASFASIATLASAGRARAQSVSYTYDVFGRLSTVTYPSGVVTTYTYDVANNRTQVTTGAPPPPPPLAAVVSPTSWEGGPSGEDGPVHVSVTGGVTPYGYLWERVSGNTSTGATDPADSDTSWIYTGSPAGPPKVSSWRCKVTDAASTVTYTGNVAVRMLMS